MVVFLDTNIIIDHFDQRELSSEAERIFEFCATEGNRGVVASLSLSHFFYLFRKSMTVQERKDDIRRMVDLFTIGAINKRTIEAALELDMDDLEDAIQAVCAKACRAEILITNNVKDFAGSPVRPMGSREFVERYSS